MYADAYIIYTFTAMNKYAVIVAGGSGSRMGAAIPKQFLLLKGRAVLWYTLETFLSAYEDLQIILVLPVEHTETGLSLARVTRDPGRIRLVSGGLTRFESVRNGLELVSPDSLVAVHDGVRCLVSARLIQRCFEQAAGLGSAIPVIACRDSVRRVEGTEAAISSPVDRSALRLVQTPQTFRSEVLLPAFRVPYHPGFTDEATVVEASGTAVHLIEGEDNNIKITTPIDLVIAESLLGGV